MININFGGFGDMLEMLPWRLEVKLGNEIVQSEQMQMPLKIMQAQFFQMCEQIAQETAPMKVTLWGIKDVELPNGEWVTRDRLIRFANNAYMANFNIED